jgi:hypothetical protein
MASALITGITGQDGVNRHGIRADYPSMLMALISPQTSKAKSAHH